MDHQMNQKYFTAKASTPLLIAGLVLVLLGLVAAFAVYELRIIGIVVAVVGGVMLLLSSSKKVKDSDVDDGIARAQKAFEEEFVDKFITDHSRSAGLKVSADAPKPKRRGKPEYFYCYWFKDVQHVKRGGDGKARSSTYCFSGILIDPDELSLGKKLASLIEAKADETWTKAPFAELEKAELVDAPVDAAYTQFARYAILRVTKKGGEIFAEIPLTADATADKIAAEINQSIARFAE
ncbi:MAG: hypothetical protein IKD37_02860 [Clostridia bacterium]|nr:hypothetical protein [Clostridia bacterium]